jgi:hypothetical protein
MMRINRRTLGASATIVIACLLATAIHSTTIARMDLRELAQSTQVIVRARCEGSRTKWDGGSIWTFYEFTTMETLKGSPPQILQIRLPGGRVGHLETKVDGVPQFRAGEEVVLFAEQIAGGCSITSWAQGTFRVHRDAAGEAHLTQDTSHFAVFDPGTRSFTPSGIRDISLVEFRKQVSEALHSEGARR